MIPGKRGKSGPGTIKGQRETVNEQVGLKSELVSTSLIFVFILLIDVFTHLGRQFRSCSLQDKFPMSLSLNKRAGGRVPRRGPALDSAEVEQGL